MQPSKSVGDTTSKGEIGSSCSESSLLSFVGTSISTSNEKVQMLKSTESVATSSFVDVGEMEKSGQSLEIVSPVDSTPVEGIPVHPYDKSESSFEHSSPISRRNWFFLF
jgi:hypothetical protein